MGCESQFIDQLQINSNIEHIMPYAKIREKQSLQILQEPDEQTPLVWEVGVATSFCIKEVV